MYLAIKKILKSKEIDWKSIVYQAFIFSLIVSSTLIILSNIAFNWYVDSNYFFFLIAFCLLVIVASPVITIILIPVFFIFHFLFVFYLIQNAKKLDKEQKIELIKTKLSKLKIKNISAENLSKLVLLPKSEVKNILNLLVVMKLADLTVDKNYKIIYKIYPNIENILQNIVKRMIDAP